MSDAIEDHDHEEFRAPSNIVCQRCGKDMDICAYCNDTIHKCEADSRVLPGYRIVPDFPDYMVNKQATVRHIRTQRYCMLMRVTKQGGAMINVTKNGKKFTRAAQDLRDSAFPDEE